MYNIAKKINTHNGFEVEFCLNCNDMDDLAVRAEAAYLDLLQERFSNCRETGRFDGDFCSRIFVAKDGVENIPFLTDEDELL
ncbi:MAG: hypothetical protein KFH87_08550 [Bacteroidetes bacterium]|nr:hypothetical protein [Bacteroidota bacterium]